MDTKANGRMDACGYVVFLEQDMKARVLMVLWNPYGIIYLHLLTRKSLFAFRSIDI